eukprot:TRINITY_DN17292_c0_g1_i1.p1 TRINITY_DN17292_c0_g1~~TRINITY_DN17292_c0_g1_i1.p1  ORF type:complete len:1638 (+),score=296.56 TRINITY_DN17292_c0_g1_i1:54-4967(+)
MDKGLFTVHVAVKSLIVVPKENADYQNSYELLWRSSKGALRGGATEKRTVEELKEEWGELGPGNSVTFQGKRRTVVLCLAMYRTRSVEYSAEVELDLKKVICKSNTRKIFVVFPLKHFSAELTLHASWYAREQPTVLPWDPPHTDVVCTSAVSHPLSPLSSKTSSNDRKDRRLTSMLLSNEATKAFVNMVSNSWMGLGKGKRESLAGILDDISALFEAEEMKQVPYHHAIASSIDMFERFLLDWNHQKPCKDLLLATSNPEQSLLSILSKYSLTDADLTVCVSEWLETIALNIISEHDLVPHSRSKEASNKLEIEKSRMHAYRILKTALHRYFYSKCAVALRRPPLASGPWLRALNNARLRDQNVRERLAELKGTDPDISEWGVNLEIQKSSLADGVERLSKLKGCALSPFDAVVTISRASISITKTVENITGSLVGADVFFPLFAWCVAEADLNDASEMQCIIENFLTSRPVASLLLSSELEYYITCYSAAVSYLESNNIRESDDTSSSEWSEEGNNDSDPDSDEHDAQAIDREYREWLKVRREQSVRDRANETWMAEIKSVPMLWRNSKLKGRRRGWFWRQGLRNRIHFRPESYICHLGTSMEKYRVLADKLDHKASSKRTLEFDLKRTLSGFGPTVAAQPELYITKLRDLLTAFANVRPDLGYVQGMGYIALMFLLHSDDTAEAFMGFTATIHSPVISDFYNFDTTEMEVQFRTFDLLFQQVAPTLFKHLSKLNVATRTFLFDWWMTLWTRQFDYDTIAAPLWNLYIGGGSKPHLLHSISIGILNSMAPQLLSKNDEQVLITLSQLRTVRLDADLVLASVQNIVSRISSKNFKDALNAVRSSDPSLQQMQASASVPHHKYHTCYTRRRVPIDEDTSAVVLWFASRPHPAASGEVPGLREWVWDYSKHTMSSKWDALLKYAESMPHGTVRCAGVDYVEWINGLITSWAETDEEYAALHAARWQGLIFVEQIPDSMRILSPASSTTLLHKIFSRIPRMPPKGWSPHTYLSVASGPIFILGKSDSSQAKPTPYRSPDPYSISSIPHVIPKRVEGTLSQEVKEEALDVDISVWCKNKKPRVTELHVSKMDHSSLYCVASDVYQPLESIASQLSPTERLQLCVPKDTTLQLTVCVKTMQQLNGSCEVIGTTAAIAFRGEPLSLWVPLTLGQNEIGKVNLSVTTPTATERQKKQQRIEERRKSIGRKMQHCDERILTTLFQYCGPSTLLASCLGVCKPWHKHAASCMRATDMWGAVEQSTAAISLIHHPMALPAFVKLAVAQQGPARTSVAKRLALLLKKGMSADHLASVSEDVRALLSLLYSSEPNAEVLLTCTDLVVSLLRGKLEVSETAADSLKELLAHPLENDELYVVLRNLITRDTDLDLHLLKSGYLSALNKGLKAGIQVKQDREAFVTIINRLCVIQVGNEGSDMAGTIDCIEALLRQTECGDAGPLLSALQGVLTFTARTPDALTRLWDVVLPHCANTEAVPVVQWLVAERCDGSFPGVLACIPENVCVNREAMVVCLECKGGTGVLAVLGQDAEHESREMCLSVLLEDTSPPYADLALVVERCLEDGKLPLLRAVSRALERVPSPTDVYTLPLLISNLSVYYKQHQSAEVLKLLQELGKWCPLAMCSALIS